MFRSRATRSLHHRAHLHISGLIGTPLTPENNSRVSGKSTGTHRVSGICSPVLSSNATTAVPAREVSCPLLCVCCLCVLLSSHPPRTTKSIHKQSSLRTPRPSGGLRPRNRLDIAARAPRRWPPSQRSPALAAAAGLGSELRAAHRLHAAENGYTDAAQGGRIVQNRALRPSIFSVVGELGNSKSLDERRITRIQRSEARRTLYSYNAYANDRAQLTEQ